MMTFEQQIEWVDEKISLLELQKIECEFLKDEIQLDINALRLIRSGYEKAYKDSISLSWINNPDRMGGQ